MLILELFLVLYSLVISPGILPLLPINNHSANHHQYKIDGYKVTEKHQFRVLYLQDAIYEGGRFGMRDIDCEFRCT